MSSILKTYTRLVEKYPWRMSMAKGGALMGLGDLLAQMFAEKKQLREMEGGRFVRFALIGALYMGPAVKGWYGYLDKMLGPTGAKNFVKKVAADQLIFAPVFLGSLLGVIEASRNGRDMEKTKEYVRHVWTDVMITNWIIWPPVQLGIFYSMPMDYRHWANHISYQSVALIFNAYLAWKTNIRDHVRPMAPPAEKQQRLTPTLEDFERAG